MAQIAIAGLLMLAPAGCSIPLTSDDPLPAPTPKATTASTPSTEGAADLPDADVFDPACREVPEPVVEWLDQHSWEYSKTRPAGAGQMVAGGGGWYVVAVPTTGDFDVKGWAWLPGDGYPIARIMPLPADWDDIDPGDDHPSGAEYYKKNLPIAEGAYTAAMDCIEG